MGIMNEFGILLPTRETLIGQNLPTRGIVDFAARAERLGFDSVWAGDALSTPRVEPLTILSAAAAVTERVTLGTASLIPAYRTAVPAAQQIVSLDRLSEGRLVLGVGAGFPGMIEREFGLIGVDPKTRFGRLDETVELWRAMWSGATEFHGRYTNTDWLPELAKPHRPGGPPIWLAGATPSALARTARRYDGWLPYPPSAEFYADGLATIRESAQREITPALFATVLVDDDEERGRKGLDAYCQAMYRMPLDQVDKIQVMLTGSAEQVAEGLRRYHDAGARHVIIRMATLDAAAHLDEVAALLGAG
jgi:alkanesulfonate monooxygenase SsuD/methylene tetrahydromethanopterin reductase-like flavin-dependent oxidoreductase (luciferase family)